MVIAPLKFGPVQFQALGAYDFALEIEDHAGPIITSFSVTLNLPQVARQPR